MHSTKPGSTISWNIINKQFTETVLASDINLENGEIKYDNSFLPRIIKEKSLTDIYVQQCFGNYLNQFENGDFDRIVNSFCNINNTNYSEVELDLISCLCFLKREFTCQLLIEEYEVGLIQSKSSRVKTIFQKIMRFLGIKKTS